MNIDAFNRVIAPAINAQFEGEYAIKFEKWGDGLTITATDKHSSTSVNIPQSDVEIYSVKFQSLVAMLTDRIWFAIMNFEPEKLQ